jgi:hypothetical protein
VARIVFEDSAGRLFAQADLDAAIARGADPRLIRALAGSLSVSARFHPRNWPYYSRKVARAIRHNLFGGLLEKASRQLRQRI